MAALSGNEDRTSRIEGILTKAASFSKHSVFLVIDNPHGQAAPPIWINHATREPKITFTVGAKVVINDAKLGTEGNELTPHFIVDNPFHVQLTYFPDGLAYNQDSDSLRLLGHSFFSAGYLLHAAELYTLAISAAQLDSSKGLAFSLRAEVHLRLEMYDIAKDDAQAAVYFRSHPDESLGRSLVELGQYIEANRISAGLNESTMYSRLVSESMHGVHDLSQFVLAGCHSTYRMKVADFVGPVEVRMSEARKGRGLFVTRNVQRGELLLVYNSAFSTTAQEDNLSIMFGEAFRACHGSRRTLQQMLALAEVGRVEQAELPSIDIFLPNRGLPDPSTSLDIRQVDVPAFLNKVMLNLENVYEPGEGKWECSTAMFTLPSLVNHSCTPNVSFLNVGVHTLYVFASRDITAGEEMVRCYGDSFMHRDCVKEQLWCERCMVEERLGQPLAAFWERLVNAYTRHHEGKIDVQTRNKERIRIAVEVEQLLRKRRREKVIEEVEMDWIRVMYASAYCAFYETYETKQLTGGGGGTGLDIMPSGKGGDGVWRRPQKAHLRWGARSGGGTGGVP